jgi:hypothetical protein
VRVVRRGEGLNYRLQFLHDGAWMHAVTVSPHNMDRVITQVWKRYAADEVLYEDVANSRIKAIRFPGRRY